jgi:hypothetical protein
MRTSIHLLLFTMVASVACAHRRADRPVVRREPVVEAGPAGTGWKRLGERRVDGTNDRDVIAVGAREGEFRKIMIVVEQSAVELHDVVVHFGDGSHFSPPTRLVFGPNTRSGVIDLPGSARIIKNVEFRYGNLPGGGRAEVQLWAR